MGLLDRMDKKTPGVQPGASVIELDEAAALRDRVHYQVVETLNKRDEKHGGGASEAETRTIIESALEQHASSMARPERNRIATEIYDSIRGLG
ncbi:MAG: hypothetical protein ABFC56_05830, partial [Clostridiaceae bacterium]